MQITEGARRMLSESLGINDNNTVGELLASMEGHGFGSVTSTFTGSDDQILACVSLVTDPVLAKKVHALVTTYDPEKEASHADGIEVSRKRGLSVFLRPVWI